MRWITRWIWQKPLAEQEQEHGETWLAIDEDASKMAGYGTWKHVDTIGTATRPIHIQIAWFGVDLDYQGQVDETGVRVADRIYASIEQVALRNPSSTEDMPFTLVCHVNNERGRRFWQRHGYQLIGDPKLRIEDKVYERMVR